jgi:hypothetical protein
MSTVHIVDAVDVAVDVADAVVRVVVFTLAYHDVADSACLGGTVSERAHLLHET